MNEKEEKPTELKITITVDGEEYELVPARVPNRVELELYATTGLTVNELLMAETWPRFMIASVIFLARRTRGDVVTWDEVAEGITYDTIATREIAGLPKAPEAT